MSKIPAPSALAARTPAAPRLDRVSVHRLNPAPYNPRRMDSKSLEKLKKSLRDHGFVEPVVARESDGLLIGGHQRLAAAVALGMEDVPVAWVEVSDQKAKALNVALNNPNLQGTFDPEKLALLLEDLRVDPAQAEMTGFGPEEIDRILAEAKGERTGLTDPDDVPEPPDAAETKPGDLYVLGDHRLLCGRAEDVADLDRLLDGRPVHLLNTDPPYNVKVEPRSNNAIAAGLSSFEGTEASRRGRSVRRGVMHHQAADLDRHPEKSKPTHRKMRAKDRPLENDFVSDDDFRQLLRGWFGNAARVLLPGRGFYIWGGYSNIGNYPPALAEAGLYFSQAIIWVKEHPVLTRKDYMGNHEWCFYGWKEGAAHYFDPDTTNETDVWSVKKVSPQKMVHLTEKPVELAARAIRYSSHPGESVLDLFGGSGSTLIAAEQTARRARLLEIDPLYCDVIVRRWEAFTGKKAERERPAVGGASAAGGAAASGGAPAPGGSR